MKNLFCALAALTCLVSTISTVDVANADKRSKNKVASKADTDYIDIKLPVTAPITTQWIVLVNGEDMQIVPASAVPEEDGVIISATVPQVQPATLQGALVVTADGNTIATPLRTRK